MAVKNGLARFATEGFRIQRLNPDGTIPRPGRVVGFSGRVDLSGNLLNGQSKLIVKVGTHDEQERMVDFSGVADPRNVTVEEAVTAINEAGFSEVIASVDPATGRLILGAAGMTPSQIHITYTRTSSGSALTIPVNNVNMWLLADGTTYVAHDVSIVFEAGSLVSQPVILTETRNRVFVFTPVPIGLSPSWGQVPPLLNAWMNPGIQEFPELVNRYRVSAFVPS